MPDDFRTTQWSLVLAANEGDPERNRALGRLFEIYWYPLYAYVRRHGAGAEEARDLVQSFFVRLMEKDVLRDVDPTAGRFRGFLLTSIRNFVANERARERALKRRGDDPAFAVPLEDAEASYRDERGRELDAERLFERRWALAILERALERMGAHYRLAGRKAQFDALRPYLTGDADAAYAEVAGRLGMSEGAVKTTIHRMRRRLGDALRDEVRQTVADADQVDDEIRYLLLALA